jgi:hypothetical protein
MRAYLLDDFPDWFLDQFFDGKVKNWPQLLDQIITGFTQTISSRFQHL